MIYLLPGMGATSAMYVEPWRSLQNAIPVDWPEYRGEKTIEEMADRLIDQWDIQATDEVIGSSLGGIVGLEIHRRIGLRHLVLIGSAIARDEVNTVLLALAPLAKVTPIRLIQYLAGKRGNHVSAMFADVDPNFVRAMCVALSKWEGCDVDMQAVSRIHGERDTIIKCPKDARIIEKGGHLITMTHAEECVHLVAQRRS